MKLFRDPLVHFVALGAVLFGLVTFTGGDDARPPDEIVVTTGHIASLQAIFAKTWQRHPSQAETENLVAEYVRDEVLYREAVAMGLDQDDTIIRRRLRQKLEFVADIASEAGPTDAELREYIAAHPEWFRDEPRLSFTHVFFSADNPVAADTGALDGIRVGLQDASLSESETGDAFLAGFDFQALTHSDAVNVFGEDFAQSVEGIGLDRWEGPIASAYGIHLVRVTERTDAQEMPFERIREIARRELMNERRLAAAETLYEELRARYVVTVEPAPTAEPRLAQVVQ